MLDSCSLSSTQIWLSKLSLKLEEETSIVMNDIKELGTSVRGWAKMKLYAVDVVVLWNGSGSDERALRFVCY